MNKEQLPHSLADHTNVTSIQVPRSRMPHRYEPTNALRNRYELRLEQTMSPSLIDNLAMIFEPYEQQESYRQILHFLWCRALALCNEGYSEPEVQADALRSTQTMPELAAYDTARRQQKSV